MKAIFLITVLLWSPVLSAGLLELNPGDRTKLEANTPTEIWCKESPNKNARATIFADTMVYAGANCEKLKARPELVMVDQSVEVFPFASLECENQRYLLVPRVDVGEPEKTVRAMVKSTDLVFEQ